MLLESNGNVGRITRILCHPMIATLLAVALLVVGVYGSLYGTDIRTNVGCHIDGWLSRLGGSGSDSRSEAVSCSLNVYSVVFAFAVALVSIIYFYRERALSALNHARQQQLADKSDHVAMLIRTLPPREFLDEFARGYSLATVVYEALRTGASVTKEELNMGIRQILDNVVNMTRAFAGRPQRSEFAANLMVYLPVNKLSSSERADYESRIRFKTDEESISKMPGILKLEGSLSTTTATPSPDSDPALAHSDLILPLPERLRAKSGKWRVLPGATMAAVSQAGYDAYENSETLGQWCREHADFAETVIDELEEYFAGPPGNRIQSFASFALRRPALDFEAPTPAAEGENVWFLDDGRLIVRDIDRPELAWDVLGILNIHRDQEFLLGQDRRPDFFYPFVLPFCSIMNDLLVELKRLENR